MVVQETISADIAALFSSLDKQRAEERERTSKLKTHIHQNVLNEITDDLRYEVRHVLAICFIDVDHTGRNDIREKIKEEIARQTRPQVDEQIQEHIPIALAEQLRQTNENLKKVETAATNAYGHILLRIGSTL